MGPCFSYDSSISFPCLSLHNIPRMYFLIPSNENALVIVIKSLYSPEPDLRCQPMRIFKKMHKAGAVSAQWSVLFWLLMIDSSRNH